MLLGGLEACYTLFIGAAHRRWSSDRLLAAARSGSFIRLILAPARVNSTAEPAQF